MPLLINPKLFINKTPFRPSQIIAPRVPGVPCVSRVPKSYNPQNPSPVNPSPTQLLKKNSGDKEINYICKKKQKCRPAKKFYSSSQSQLEAKKCVHSLSLC